MAQDDNHLIWIDLEMTGLDTDQDYIIEIATIITNIQLDIIAEGPVFAIYQPDAILATMDEWNTSHHQASGLVDRIKLSQVDVSQAEQQTIDFLAKYIAAGKSPMCGNSICQDRRFLARLMPKLEQYFHYRNLDVSTIKELARRWAPQMSKGFSKDSSHLALEDIRDSINELRYYQQHFFQL